MTEYFACEELECQHLRESNLKYCEEAKHCPFAWQRRGQQDRADAARRDAEAKG